MKREVMKVSWEQREFYGNKTLLHCFQKVAVLETEP
jgi:hypothetical protein